MERQPPQLSPPGEAAGIAQKLSTEAAESRTNLSSRPKPERKRRRSGGTSRSWCESGIQTNQEERIDDVKERRCVEGRAPIAEERADNVEERRFSAA